MKTGRAKSTNGKPLIVLNPGAKYLFSFGIDKARMIVEAIEDIRAFIAEAGAEPVKVYFTHPNGGKGQSQYATREAAEAGIASLRAAGFECSLNGQQAPAGNGAASEVPDAIRAHVNGNGAR